MKTPVNIVSGSPDQRLRRTKIVATVGPATDDGEVLDQVIRAGMDVARVNFSHGEFAHHESRVNMIRDLAENCNRHVGIMVDLQGPKIRIKGFREGKVTLKDGDPFTLDTGLGDDDGDHTRVGVAYEQLARDVKPKDLLLLADGNVVIEVQEVDGGRIHCKVRTGGALSNNKGLNRLGGGLSAGALTPKDYEDIHSAARLDADYLAVSFVRNADDVKQARTLLHAAGGNGLIVSKIERAEAISNIDEIIAASDAIMIARGDLGVEVGFAELPGMQKDIIRRGRDQNRIVITATEMMQSMVDNPQPTRAEVLDVANAVMDGTDAVMLSAESAVGKYPVQTVKAMARICQRAEHQPETYASTHRLEVTFTSTDEAVAMAAMYTANHFHVRAIVTMTESGGTAQWMSRISSVIPIFAMSRQIATLRRVTLYRGVYPVYFDVADDDNVRAEKDMIQLLRKLGVVDDGDSVIVTHGDLTGVVGGTNSMKIVQV